MHMKKGAFSAQAKRAGMSTRTYAHKVLKAGYKATAKTKSRSRLALRLMKMH
jgi:hypothetical protein